MNVLAINCGSSSIKCGVVEAASRSDESGGVRRLASGRIEKLGADKAQLRLEADGGTPVDATEAVRDHAEAVRRIAEWIGAQRLAVDAVGHRVVHGGPRFVTPTVL